VEKDQRERKDQRVGKERREGKGRRERSVVIVQKGAVQRMASLVEIHIVMVGHLKRAEVVTKELPLPVVVTKELPLPVVVAMVPLLPVAKVPLLPVVETLPNQIFYILSRI
jgi:hypothetical protein